MRPRKKGITRFVVHIWKCFVSMIFCFVCLPSFAQDAKTVKNVMTSNAEKFSEKSGTLIQKEFADLGDVKKCKVQIATFTDLISNQKTSAVRFEYETANSYGSSTKLALLDVDEIDGLIKSFKIIQDKIFPTTPINYSEVSFTSRSGFEAGAYVGKSGWSAFLKLEKYDSKSFVFIEKEDLPKLISILEQAKSKL